MTAATPTNNRVLWTACGLLAACAGCQETPQGPKDRARVSGTITYDGQPLPAGTISFRSLEGPVASTVLFENGEYSTGRAPIGKCAVTIDTRSMQASAAELYLPIPEKYGDPTASGLAADVKPGDNENVDFALEE